MVRLIILLTFVTISSVGCRSGGHGKIIRVRISSRNSIKNKFHSNNIHRPSSFLHKSSNRILIRGQTLLVGTLALQSYVTNNYKESIGSRFMLTNGTGSLCVNKENFSNFIFNEFRCPLLPIFQIDNRFCCGSYHRQYCCSFWASDGRTIGITIGIILTSILLILSIFYYRGSLRRAESEDIRAYLKYPGRIPLCNNVLILPFTEGKGFSGGRGGGTFKVGSKGSGTFGAPSSNNRPNNYRPSMSQPRGGSSFKSKAISFAAGAAGGIAAYSLMRSMSSSFHSRPGGNYGPGYGVGETCVNNEDMNGTSFGEFRCPLDGFPYEAKSCCGEYEKQFCCIPEGNSRFLPKASSFGWIVLGIIIVLIVVLICIRHRRRREKDVIMIPTEPPVNQDYAPPPPPPFYNPSPANENPYGVPPGNQSGHFNPYAQQPYMTYPPQNQSNNPY